MNQCSFKRFAASLIFMMLCCSVSACVTARNIQPDDRNVISRNIIYDIPQSCEITKISYYYKDYNGKEELHFEVGIKNTTEQPLRFRLNILLPEGPAVGGMYPRKEKAIDPGETLSQEFPVYIDHSKLPENFMPTGFTLVIKEL